MWSSQPPSFRGDASICFVLFLPAKHNLKNKPLQIFSSSKSSLKHHRLIFCAFLILAAHSLPLRIPPRHWWIPKTSLAAAESHQQWCPRLLTVQRSGGRWAVVFFLGGVRFFASSNMTQAFCWHIYICMYIYILCIYIYIVCICIYCLYIIYIYINISCILYINMDLSGRSPRSTLHVFQHSCKRHWKSLSFLIHSVNAQGWSLRIHRILLLWISIWAGNSNLGIFPEKNHQFRKNFHSIFVCFSNPSALSSNLITLYTEDKSRFVWGLPSSYTSWHGKYMFKGAHSVNEQCSNHPKWFDNFFLHQSWRRKGKHACLSYFINTDWYSKTKNHIISPTKHWGGTSKFHPPRRGSSPDPIEQNNLTLSTQLCLWGCLAQHLHQSPDTFPVSAHLQNLLGELGIPEKKGGFECIPKDHSLWQPATAPWWTHDSPMNILHTAQWKCCGNVKRQKWGKWGKKGLGGSTKKIHWKESCGWKLWSWYVYYTYIYIYICIVHQPEKVCPIWKGSSNWLIQQLWHDELLDDQSWNPKQEKFGHSDWECEKK